MAGNKAARAIHLDSGRWKGTNGEPEINSTVPAVHTAGSSIAGKKEAARETREEANLPPNAKSGGSLDPEHMWKHKGGNWRDWEEMPRLQGAPSAPGGRPPEYTGPDFSVFRKELFVKLVLSIMAFAGVWGMFHMDRPWAIEGQRLVRDALTQDMNFDAVAVWYENTFSGSPAFIPIFGEHHPQAQKASGQIKESTVMPVEDGIIVRSFAELLNGVEIASSKEGSVHAVQTGRVLLVSGNGPDRTVVIQHSGKRVTIYGQLGGISVAQNDWVEAGDTIGSVKPGTGQSPGLLFFAVKEDDHYVDPAEVIAFE